MLLLLTTKLLATLFILLANITIMLGYLGAHCRVSWCPHHGAALILRALLSLLLMAASRCLSLSTQVTSLRAALAKCSSTKVAAAAARPPHTTRKVTCRGAALVYATL